MAHWYYLWLVSTPDSGVFNGGGSPVELELWPALERGGFKASVVEAYVALESSVEHVVNVCLELLQAQVKKRAHRLKSMH